MSDSQDRHNFNVINDLFPDDDAPIDLQYFINNFTEDWVFENETQTEMLHEVPHEVPPPVHEPVQEQMMQYIGDDTYDNLMEMFSIPAFNEVSPDAQINSDAQAEAISPDPQANISPDIPAPKVSKFRLALDQVMNNPSTSSKRSHADDETELIQVSKRPKTVRQSLKQQYGGGTGAATNHEIIFEKNEFEPAHNKRFHRHVYRKAFKIKHNFQEVDLLKMDQVIDDIFSEFLSEAMTHAKDSDVVAVTITHSSLNKPIYVSYRKENFDIQSLLNKIYKTHQSQAEESFLLKGKFDVEVAVIERVEGGSRGERFESKKCAPREASEKSKLKRSVVLINNRDNACGYMAIALGLWDKNNPKVGSKDDLKLRTLEWDKIKKNKAQRLTNAAKELCINAGVNFNQMLNVDSMKIIDNYLKPHYQLITVDAENRANRIFAGETAPKQIYIEYLENHFNLITSITGYFECGYVCVPCWRPFREFKSHTCPNSCPKCYRFPPCGTSAAPIICKDCNFSFFGETCFENHKLTTCHILKKCPQCDMKYRVADKHKCGEYWCKKCTEFFPGRHECFISPKDKAKLQKQDQAHKIICCFDIESSLEKKEKDGKVYYEHVPNLIICNTVCDTCFDYDSSKKNCVTCDKCGTFEKIFLGNDCVPNFGAYIYKVLARQAEKNKGRLFVFAHNFKGYDGHFIFKDMYDRPYKPEPVMVGTKIMMCDVNNVRFMDSVCLFQQPLACLPRSFGFSEVVIKGYFPHLFNQNVNWNYRGVIPDKSYFDYDTMNGSSKVKFDTWYESVQDQEWVLQDELVKYCKNDVLILLLAVQKFRHGFKTVTGLDPITRNFTLASIGLEAYRANFLEEKTLGITPTTGYSNRKSSKIEESWIDWKEVELSKKLTRGKKIGHYITDAYDPDTNTVFEFWGCYWHGCPKCYDNRDEPLLFKEGVVQTAADLHYEMMKKMKYYKDHGFNVEEIWECDFKQELKHSLPPKVKYINQRMKYHAKRLATKGANIREAFFGGRTNNLKFHYEAKINEKIEYKDVTSEYPYVLKNRFYPVGHPNTIRQDFDYSLKTYFGFIKCTILPPKKLYLPVIPSRFNEKLEFVLCRTCAATSNQQTCSHTDEQRSLTGTWTHVELLKALEKGYEITEIIEVLHYPKTSDQLFRKYIDMWLKVKQEASGWPEDCNTEEKKLQYIAEYNEKEGILLDYDKISKNLGLRTITKLMLNSFWGKLSQRPNLPKTKVCKEYAEYWEILTDEELTVLGEFSPNELTQIISYELKDIDDADPGNTNVAVAAFVTSYARLHLYKFMDLVLENGNDRLLYFDTDSIIFINREGDKQIECGKFLGDLTDELADYGPGARCTKFVSGGPKNYGYEVQVPQADGSFKTHCTMKTKGIKHNALTLDLVTIQKMTDMVKEYYSTGKSTQLSVPQLRFYSDKFEHFMRSEYMQKIYQIVSEKRRVIGNDTLPFGYVD